MHKKPITRFERLRVRAQVNRRIRNFFHARGLLEVETPLLSGAATTDPAIESFSTRFSGHVDGGPCQRWLRTSPELPLKRLLAEGMGDCYELGRVFRNGEVGRGHNPEFTLLEWYRVGWNERALADETIALLQSLMAEDGPLRVEQTTYRDLFLQRLNLDPWLASDQDCWNALAPIQLDRCGLDRDDCLNLLLTHRIQPSFTAQTLTVIYDWPSSQCALAQLRPGQPPVAERFEIYLGQFEVANGYHELNDPVEQRARFVGDNHRRQARGDDALPIDERFLHAMDKLPACAGVAVGIDRILMALCGTSAIADVLAYDFASA